MPTYDYRCDDCGHEFELFQSITDRVRRKCPACGERKLRRLIGSGAGILFRGSGFYQTDYRSDSYKKAAEAEKKASEKKKDSGKSGDGGSKARDGGGASGSDSTGGKKKDG